MCTNHVFRILKLFMFSLAQAFGINLHLLYILYIQRPSETVIQKII